MKDRENELEKLEKCRHECKIVCLLDEFNKKCDELERIKKERDAAIRDLRSSDTDCNCCIYAGAVVDCDLECGHCSKACMCGKCTDNNLWQWRGTK